MWLAYTAVHAVPATLTTSLCTALLKPQNSLNCEDRRWMSRSLVFDEYQQEKKKRKACGFLPEGGLSCFPRLSFSGSIGIRFSGCAALRFRNWHIGSAETVFVMSCPTGSV